MFQTAPHCIPFYPVPHPDNLYPQPGCGSLPSSKRAAGLTKAALVSFRLGSSTGTLPTMVRAPPILFDLDSDALLALGTVLTRAGKRQHYCVFA